MKPHTITIELPTGGASAPQMLAEVQTFVAQLAQKHGCKVETDKRLMGWAFRFVQRFIPPSPVVVPLFRAAQPHNHISPPSAA